MHREQTLTRQIHNLLQGSDDWHSFRFNHHGASEAAAMLGLAPKVTRTELVRMKATGLAKEFSDWVQENILDYGHEVEAMARPFAEKIIGDELYPVTCSLGAESASCDGLTMSEATGFEHKQWNAELAASVAADILPEEHQPQVQQQLMVTGAEKWLFMVSDGTEANMVWMWVYPDVTWFERIRAGWEQFDIDVANYTQVVIDEKPAPEPIAALPALVVQTEGKVVSSNLVAYKAAAEKFIAKISTCLETDEDFANAENNAKFCGEAEDKLELAKAAALAQTATIDEVLRTVDHIKEQFRAKRLQLEKLVKTRKEQIKETILNDGRRQYGEHLTALESEIAPLRLALPQPDFASAMKNKRTLASLHDAVNTTLANANILANTAAADIRSKQTWMRENAADYRALFMDLQQMITKPMDDFQLVVRTRIADHQRAEAAKAEALRTRIEAEERAKAEVAAAAQLAAERQADAERAAAAEQAERARVAAETKRQLEAQAAQIAAKRLAEAQSSQVTTQTERPTTASAAIAQANALAEQARLADMADAQVAAADTAPDGDLFSLSGTAPATPPTLRLGQINERIAPLAISADGLRALGFEPAATDKSAKLYHERDFRSMCAALRRHVDAVQQQYAA